MKPEITFPLETDRLILRPFESSDAENYFKITRDVLTQYFVGFMCPLNMEESKYLMDHFYSCCDFDKRFNIAIEEKTSKALIGSIEITKNENFEYYDIAYFIDKPFRKKGYIKEAIYEFLKYWPQNRSLIFEVFLENEPSLNFISHIPGIIQKSTFGDDYFAVFCIHNRRT